MWGKPTETATRNEHIITQLQYSIEPSQNENSKLKEVFADKEPIITNVKIKVIICAKNVLVCFII